MRRARWILGVLGPPPDPQGACRRGGHRRRVRRHLFHLRRLQVRATCEAAVLDDGVDLGAWREIPIAIEVRLGEVLVGRGTLRCTGPDAAPAWEKVAGPVGAGDG